MKIQTAIECKNRNASCNLRLKENLDFLEMDMIRTTTTKGYTVEMLFKVGCGLDSKEGNKCYLFHFYDEEERINEYDLTIFVREEHKSGEELFRKFEETHFQRGYELCEMKQFLEEAGMEFIRAYDADTLEEVTDTSERIYCIARERGK